MLTDFRAMENPPCNALRDDAAASTASHPNVRDDRDTPLARDGMARDTPVIWVGRTAEYFSSEGWTGQISDLPSAGEGPRAFRFALQPWRRLGQILQECHDLRQKPLRLFGKRVMSGTRDLHHFRI